MIVVNRLQVPETDAAAFRAVADTGVAHYRACAGNESADLVQNLDEQSLWALVTRWRDVGSYRAALGGYDAKMALMPLMMYAIDEPSAYDDPDEVGFNLPREVG